MLSLNSAAVLWLKIVAFGIITPPLVSIIKPLFFKTIFRVEKKCFFCNGSTTLYNKKNILAFSWLRYLFPSLQERYGSYMSSGTENSWNKSSREIPEPYFDEKGILRHWFCKICDSYNVYDESQDLVTPNSQTVKSGLLRPYLHVRTTPIAKNSHYRNTPNKFFCDKCIENQELNRLSLALASSEENCNDEIFSQKLQAQLKSISERFPIACSSCTERIERYILALNKKLTERVFNYTTIVSPRKGVYSSWDGMWKMATGKIVTLVKNTNYPKFIACLSTAYFTVLGLLAIKYSTTCLIKEYLENFYTTIRRVYPGVCDLLPNADNILWITKNSSINEPFCSPFRVSLWMFPMNSCLGLWLKYRKGKSTLMHFRRERAIYIFMRTSVLTIASGAIITVGLSLKSDLNRAAFFLADLLLLFIPIWRVLTTLAILCGLPGLSFNIWKSFMNHIVSKTNKQAPLSTTSNSYSLKDAKLFSENSKKRPPSLIWDPIEGWIDISQIRNNGVVQYFKNINNSAEQDNIDTSGNLSPVLKSHRSIADRIATLHIGSPKYSNKIPFSLDNLVP